MIPLLAEATDNFAPPVAIVNHTAPSTADLELLAQKINALTNPETL